MPITPQITLTATLQDICGNDAGSTANPAVLRIALAGFGLTLPCIPGTSNVAQSGPEDFYDSGAGISVKLWGNDVLNPNSTYYAITVLDGEGNIVQTGAYKFTGTQTIDLSEAQQIYPVPPAPPGLIPVYTNPPSQALQTIDGSITIDGNLIVTGSINFGFSFIEVPDDGVVNLPCNEGSNFAIALTQNVTAVNFNEVTPGQQLTLLFTQDATGGRTVTYPASVLNALDAVNPVPNGKTLQILTYLPDSTLMAGGYYP
jgi:hypothetical protein